jgi:serine protease Do
VDPCEIYFDDYRNVDGRQIPHRWEVRIGDKVFGVVEVQEFSVPKAAEKKA